MALIKFITIYDDESRSLINEEIRKRYDITIWPTAYDDDVRTYIDDIHTNSVEYFRHINMLPEVTEPGIHHKIFQLALQYAYEDGYSLAMIVCPNKKWYPYYKEAIKAVNNVKRSVTKDFTTFRMRVIDTKSFAAGSLYHVMRLARMHINDHCPTGIVEEDAKSFTAKTLVLTKSGAKFGFTNGKLACFRVFDRRFYTDLKVSDSSDYVIYDDFAKAAAKYIKNSNAKYIISFGAHCDFAPNVIGRIENLLGFAPIAISQYSIPSAAVLGLDSLCIHIIE